MNAPMTPDREREIRERLASTLKPQKVEVADLLAEVDRLRARVAELETQGEKVAAHCAQRAEYITSILNCHPDNAHDYYRWQGHAESRRQLSQALGLPVGWPAEDKQSTPPVLAEDPHDSPLHHTYTLGRDLPEVKPDPTTEVALWNERHPVGTPVVAYPGCRPEDDPKCTRLTTRTRSAASVLGGHTAVVWVEGHSACIALTHIDPRPEGGAL
ncbi:hypothetical protein ACFY8V_32655 [Streptomyces californicus]|uniref:hypothetical protein n=1 Tax=Streptomyces californicus TaxID=67351 RepID=UPI0036B48D10